MSSKSTFSMQVWVRVLPITKKCSVRELKLTKKAAMSWIGVNWTNEQTSRPPLPSWENTSPQPRGTIHTKNITRVKTALTSQFLAQLLVKIVIMVFFGLGLCFGLVLNCQDPFFLNFLNLELSKKTWMAIWMLCAGRLWNAGYIKTIMTSLDLTDHVQTM